MRPFVLLAFGLILAPRIALADLADTVIRIKPSVVAVGTYQKTRSPAFRFLGTGFVIGDGSYIATNAHVVPNTLDEGQREVLVIVAGSAGEIHPRQSRLLGKAEEFDLALLKLAGSPLPALKLRAADDVREGDMLAFTGFPIGNVLGFYPVTHRATLSSITPIAQPNARANQLNAKVIKRLQAGPTPVLQLDATAYPGNSGSPLYDTERGDVVGIINMVFIKSTKEHVLSNPSGITYAIPVRHLRELLEEFGR